jgi:plastocyanin
MPVQQRRTMIALAALAALFALPGSMARAAQGGAKLSIARTGPSLATATPPAATPAPAGTPARGPDQAGPAAAAPETVSLVALPRAPRVGQHVRLTVLDPPSGATGYVWDLLGDGAYRRLGAPGWHTDTVFRSAGTHPVAVRFTAGGTVHAGILQLTIAPARASGSGAPGAAFSSTAAAGTDSAASSSSGKRSGAHSSASPSSGKRSGADSAASPRSPGRVAAPTAHTAGDPSVTIADFHFSPGATTVHVADTITWTNDGPSAHSATAGDGSFDTGVLQKGQSGSHTFTQAGTFAYICKIHPFMHGTIVVLASTSPTTTQPAQTPPASAAQTTTGSPATAAAVGQPTLPNTGMNVTAALLTGLVLLGLGAALRRTPAR